MTSTSDIEQYLTMGSPVEKSSQEFSAVPESSEPAWKRLQQGDRDATSAFIKEVTPTIDKCVASFAGNDPSYKTQARLLAIDAAKTYDPAKGGSIDTHVYNHLKRLQRISAQRTNLPKISENMSLDKLQVARAIREYQADHGSDPSTEDLANILGMSRKRIDAIMNNKAVVSEGVFTTEHGDSTVASKSTHALDLYNNAIYDELDNTDKKIYEWATGYGKGERLSNAEIAKRLNISPAAVSQRYAKISNKFAQDRDMIRRMFYEG